MDTRTIDALKKLAEAEPYAWELFANDGGRYLLLAQDGIAPQGWAKSSPLYADDPASRSSIPALIERVERAEAENARLSNRVSAEEARNEALCRRIDAERSGKTIAHCYNPEDWEYTYAWDERDEVHGHGENLEEGEPMLVFTLLRGPRKWVASVPVSFDEDGDPNKTEFRWFDSEEEARAAIGRQS